MQPKLLVVRGELVPNASTRAMLGVGLRLPPIPLKCRIRCAILSISSHWIVAYEFGHLFSFGGRTMSAKAVRDFWQKIKDDPALREKLEALGRDSRSELHKKIVPIAAAAGFSFTLAEYD